MMLFTQPDTLRLTPQPSHVAEYIEVGPRGFTLTDEPITDVVLHVKTFCGATLAVDRLAAVYRLPKDRLGLCPACLNCFEPLGDEAV